MWKATPQPSSKTNQCPEGSIIVGSTVLWRITTIDHKVSRQHGGGSATAQGTPPQHRMFRHSPEGLATARVRAGRAAYLHIYLDKINGEPRQSDSLSFTSFHKASVWRRCRWPPHHLASGTVTALPRPDSCGHYLALTLLDSPINRRVKPIAFSDCRLSVRGHKSETRLLARSFYNYTLVL